MKILIKVVLLFVVVFAWNSNVHAQENDNINVKIVLTDKSGIGTDNMLVSRGVALAKGQVYDSNDLSIVNGNGNYIPSYMEALEKYDDGSLKWVLCSMVVTLSANETKSVYLTQQKNDKLEKQVFFEKTGEEFLLENDYISMKMNSFGIAELSYMGESVLGNDGISLFCRTSATDKDLILKNAEITLIKDNPLYTKASIKGHMSDGMDGELIITMWAGGKLVDAQMRFNAKKDVMLNSLGQYIALKNNVVVETKAKYKSIVANQYIAIMTDAVRMVVASPDAEKFDGAVSPEGKTGFILAENKIKFVPMINDTAYNWLDGLTRTHHFYLGFSMVSESTSGDIAKRLMQRPSVQVDSRAFMDANLIATNKISEPLRKMLYGLDYAKDRTNKTFQAGRLPSQIDSGNHYVGMTDMRPGEMNWYLGHAYMMTGDQWLYDMIMNDAESWADVIIYKGGIDEIYGANRYRVKVFTDKRFRTSHPYYADASGLYMAYVLSGNEYFKDMMEADLNYLQKNMYMRKSNGYFYPRMYNWYTGEARAEAHVESRYMIQARSFYLGYRLFENGKYLQAAKDVSAWGAAAQSEHGWWYQAFYDDGTPYLHSRLTTPAIKTYIFLYGSRGISYYAKNTNDDVAKRQLLKLGEFLINEHEHFGASLRNPFGDKALCETDETFQRANSPVSDIMAVEILLDCYQLSNEEKYLKDALLSMRTWLAQQNDDGFPAQIMEEGYKSGQEQSPTTLQNLTFLSVYPRIVKLIEEKTENIKAMGYGDLIVAMGENNTSNDDALFNISHGSPEISYNVYEKDDKQVIYVYNKSGLYSGEYTKEWQADLPGGIYSGVRNIINTVSSTTINKKMKQFDLLAAMKLPITVCDRTGDIQIEVEEYSKDNTILRLYGDGDVILKLTSGDFKVVNGEKYAAKTIEAGENYKKVAIIKGEGNVAYNGEVTVNVNVKYYPAEFDDTEDHWVNPTLIYLVNHGIIDSYDGNYNPDEAVSIEVIKDMLAKVLGNNGKTEEEAISIIMRNIDKAESDMVRREEAARMAANIITSMTDGNLEGGADWRNIQYLSKPDNDLETVRIATEAVIINDSDNICGDIILPTNGLFDTEIKWTSSKPSVVSDEGKVNRPYGEDTEVELTAEISAGETSAEKLFPVVVKGSGKVSLTPNMAAGANFQMIREMSGEFSIKFDVITNSNNINGGVAFSRYGYAPQEFADLPIIIRFAPTGAIDVMDKTGYTALKTVKYKAGEKYSFEVNINTDNYTYDVWVTTPNGEKTQLAKAYGFRLSAPKISTVNVMFTPGSTNLPVFEVVSCDGVSSENMINNSNRYDELGLEFGRFVTNANFEMPSTLNGRPVTCVARENLHGEVLFYIFNKNILLPDTSEGFEGDMILSNIKGLMEPQRAGEPMTRAEAAVLVRRILFELEQSVEKMEMPAAVLFSDSKVSIEPQTNDFEIRYTIIPKDNLINAITGISSAQVNASAMADLPVITRFNPDGQIDVYNGDMYKAENLVTYSSGKAYSFRVLVNFDEKKYDVYVSEEGGDEVLIAKDYLFRLSAIIPEQFDTMYLAAATQNGCYVMTKCSLYYGNSKK